ncbi:hypothetical protein LR48_Vigan08g086700 [Vigna angularis]|uniref:Phosphoribulokinase, chloroplastic n=1 Tax=Phaseolus angularis TaxID=3914 RepID=A0A0L9V4P7_PHAAN|nr:hypothetical protein LR48_Vigan08g086700 [Vigna angularis]
MGAVEKKLEEMEMEYARGTVEEGGIKVDQLFFHDPNGFMIEICNCDILPVIPLPSDMVSGYYSTTQGRNSNRGINSGRSYVIKFAASDRHTVLIGLAADLGCGKTTFMRRLTSVFGGASEPPKGGNPDSNTIISHTTTVVCLDDYHYLDRTGRKDKGVTALDPRANDFDLMYDQVKAIKDGIAVQKPIYNHVIGLLDPPDLIKPPTILVIEGLHPM